MAVKPPAPVREIIDLLSSSPPSRQTSVPTTITGNDESPPMSSPLPPSPSVVFNALAERAAAAAKAREAWGSEGTAGKVSVREVPDNAGDVLLPLPAAKNKRATKATTDTGVKKPRARKSTKAETVPLKDRKIKSRVIKNPIAQIGTKSKYFVGSQGQHFTEITARDQGPISDASIALDPAPRKEALVPKSPNQLPPCLEPPLHVIRRQWTPVKNTTLTLDSSSPLANGEPKMAKKAVFGSMVDVMRYSTESTQSSGEVSAGMEDRIGNGLTKKRVIEMIGLPSSVIAASKDKPLKLLKPRAQKNKPRTITDQATASYRSAANPTASPILRFFPLQGESASNTEDTETQSSSHQKPGSPAKKKRKSDPKTIVLLSPTSARKRFDDQDFIFGTCSQLEKVDCDEDETPSTHNIPSQIDPNELNDDYDEFPPVSTSVVRRDFLKTLAKDRKGNGLFRGGREKRKDGLSTSHHDDVYLSATNVKGLSTGERGSGLSKLQKTGSGLWSAAARDLEGGLMDIEVVDMTGSDNDCLKSGIVQDNEDNRLPGNRTAATGTQVIGRLTLQNDSEESCQSITREAQIPDRTADIYGMNPVQSTRSLRGNPSNSAALVAPLGGPASPTMHKINLLSPTVSSGSSSRFISSRASGATAPTATPVGTNPADPIPNSPVASTAKKSEKTKPAPTMPDFQSYPTAQLKTEVSKFGFKNMRTRDRMVSCLERCWEARNKAASDSGLVGNTAEPPKRIVYEEETVPAPRLQEGTAVTSQGPKGSTRRKKVVDKAARKSPKRKATALRSKSLSKKTPPPDDSDDDAPGIVTTSINPKPSRKTTPGSEPRTHKSSAPPPSPQYAALKTTQLHLRISEAVRESRHIKSEFSFYNAILMYDPIVLEDLTQWLNTHMQVEVDVEDVKTWCEANGVCCVRSESLRGKQRKRR